MFFYPWVFLFKHIILKFYQVAQIRLNLFQSKCPTILDLQVISHLSGEKKHFERTGIEPRPLLLSK